MKRTLLSIFLFASIHSFGQSDFHAFQAWKFAKFVVHADSSEAIEELLNDSLINDDLENEIIEVRKSLGTNAQDIQFYTVKVNAPIPLYNINLFTGKEKQQLGDMRILFNDEKDLLIDQWKFLSPKKSDSEDENLEEIPPPPPPPPPDN